MKIERTKNASRNIVFGMILKLYQTAVPFILRTAIIYFLGIEYLGLNSLFISILSVLNLAELGVGSAMVYSMYKPIAEDDEKTICALMRLYRRYYRIIGIVILVIGIALIPFLPNLISGDVPEGINIYILYLLNLGATVVSYWLFGYKTCLLTAHQRTDISSRTLLITNTIQYALQFVALALFHNYYYYLFIALFLQAVANIISALVVDKMYPNYQPKGNLEKEKVQEIGKRVKDLFTLKVGNIILNTTDSLVISAFLGLSALAIYNNYYYIINSLVGFITVFYNAITAGVGNSLIVESEEKNYKDYETFNFIVFWIIGFCSSCLLCLYQPFMKMWVGKKLMLGGDMVALFCIYFMTIQVRQAICMYKDAAGIWHQDRFRPIFAAALNLTLNIILVRHIGLYGIIISTIIASLFLDIPWLIHNVFTNIFHRKAGKYISDIIKYIIIDTVVCIIVFMLCNMIKDDGIGIFVIKALICIVISNGLLFIIHYKNCKLQETLTIVKRMLPNKKRA